MSRRKIYAADLFAGAGGASTGLLQACQALDLDVELLAINHWDTAVETHAQNHPGANHLCTGIDQVDPKKVVPRGKLDLLLAGPSCVHHSRARGGKPMDDQDRASPWHVVHWADALRVETLIIENVEELLSWGRLGADGRPLKSERGKLFKAWVGALEALGYRVEWRVLNAADFGDATTRRRLFIFATRKHRGRTPWPDATHSRDPESELFTQELNPWRPAREIIDWSLPSQSIFTRKRPLAKTTLRRIEEGLRRFGGEAAEPFLVVLRQHMAGKSLDGPIPALCAGGTHVGLCEPFLLGHRQFKESVVDGVNRPMRTITAKNGGNVQLVQPFVTHLTHGGRVHDEGAPLPTVTGANRGELGVVEPFIVPRYGEREGQRPRTHDVADPMPTVPGSCQHGVVEPFVVQYNAQSRPRLVQEPLGTQTTRDKFGLVEPAALDIHFRMLQPHELAAAMSFPEGYKFAGNKSETVRQIGNAWAVRCGQALCDSALRRMVG